MGISIDFDERQVELILAALKDKATVLQDDVRRFATTDNDRAHQCQSDYYAVMEMVECIAAGLTYGAVKGAWERQSGQQP